MNELQWLSALMIGVAGSVHCVGMCGGIVTAFSTATPKGTNPLPYMLAYNIGRITSYAMAGALTGAVGAMVGQHAGQGVVVLNLISGVFLVLLATYIGQWWMALSRLEHAGQHIWKRLAPLSRRFLPFRSPLHAVPYGMIWGWLPCGLVYSALTWSLASGSITRGAMTMFWFGLGTLPALLLTGALSHQFRSLVQKTIFRQAIALVLIISGGVIVIKAVSDLVH
ncbi:sulfite exporter TauE/SafE family protein [Aestuariibacter salexigens]|uniref:sulfite exporter TauE/SafE family protein n=1 Tax=Aestuariibacter salexigens TaxID=226010 RepID=UPI0004219E60|nr:sulfite exporter TauE/SafE family protein [Aestuariibacter salexigens]